MPDSGTGIMQDNRSGALFSDNRTYRYRLWRTWDAAKPTLAFVMLNPSTADATSLDPTCRRCKGYAEQWGYGTLLVGNIFAYRATDPNDLRAAEEPIGPENDDHLREIVNDADMVVAAWGVHGSYLGRGQEVIEMLETDLYALDTTKDGHPNHPLYQPAERDLEVFSSAE